MVRVGCSHSGKVTIDGVLELRALATRELVLKDR